MKKLNSRVSARLPRRLTYGLSAVAVAAGATFGSFALLGSATATAAAGPDAVSGSAFGLSLSLLGSSVVPPTPTVTLPADGTAQTNSLISIPTNAVLTAGVATETTSATNASLASEVVNTSADIANPAVLSAIPGLPAGLLPASISSLLSVDAVHSVCTSSATGSTGGTTVVNLVVGGTPIPVTEALNQVPTLPSALSALLSIEINKQVVTNSVGATGITVDGIVITLASALDGGGVITLAQSVCGATGPDINAVPTVTGVTPNSGPTAGGTAVTIAGTGFNCVTGVAFGGVPATGVTTVSPTEVTATSPAGTGAVNVTVTNCNGTSPTSNLDTFTYVASTTVPTSPVAPVSPSSQSVTG
jgi:IPT/TIG domain